MEAAAELQTTTEATNDAPMDLLSAAKDVFGEEAPAAAPSEEAKVDDKPAEQQPEPAPDPKQESVAKRIAAAKRAELSAAKDRATLKSEREAIEKAKADLDAKTASYKLLETDPVKAFEVLGLDPKTFLERLAGEQAPDNVALKKIAALEEQVKAEREAREKAEDDAKQRQLRQQSDVAWQEASKGFIAHVEANATKYPHLVAEYSEGEAVAAAERALLEVVGQDPEGKPVTRAEAYNMQFGSYPDDDVIAEYLDQEAQKRVEARKNSVWAKREASPANGSQPLSNGDQNQKAPPVSRGSSPRTLTSRAASEKASAPRPKTQEEIDAESIAILEAALKR